MIRTAADHIFISDDFAIHADIILNVKINSGSEFLPMTRKAASHDGFSAQQ